MTKARPQIRPLGALLRVLVGPAIWFLHLASMYAAETLFESGIVEKADDPRMVGLAISVAGLAALSVFATVFYRSAVDDRRPKSDFLPALGLALTLVSAIAVFWTTFPLFFLISS